MTNVAWVEKLYGNYAESLKLFEEVYKTRLASQGPDDRETLSCQVNIANLYYMKGNLEIASGHYREIVEASIRNFGPEDLYTLNNQINLASVLRETAKSNEAISLLEETYQTYDKHHGKTHANTLNALLELSRTYVSTGAYAEAEFYLQNLLGLYDEVSSAVDNRLLVHSMLADCYRKMHLVEEAIESLTFVLRERQERYGLYDLLTAAALYELGMTYVESGDLGKAVENLSQADAIGVRSLGLNHPWSEQIHEELHKMRAKLNRPND